MLVCTHCNSQSVVYDQEYVAGTGWISRPRCLKCGRGKFANIDNSKQEEKVMAITTATCSVCGTKPKAAGYLCPDCFFERHGITVETYRANKAYRAEKPASVAIRLKKAPDPAAEKAAEEIKPTLCDKPVETVTDLLVVLPPEVKEALGAKAKEEYRSPEQQAAYMIDKALRG